MAFKSGEMYRREVVPTGRGVAYVFQGIANPNHVEISFAPKDTMINRLKYGTPKIGF